MRLIDADVLIEDLEYDVELDARTLDDMDFVGRDRETVQFDKDCKQNAIDILRNAPTIEPQHWIPCSNPPTERGFYKNILLYGENGNYAVGWYDEGYWTWDDRFDLDTPIAWMPLPGPFKGEL